MERGVSFFQPSVLVIRVPSEKIQIICSAAEEEEEEEEEGKEFKLLHCSLGTFENK